MVSYKKVIATVSVLGILWAIGAWLFQATAAWALDFAQATWWVVSTADGTGTDASSLTTTFRSATAISDNAGTIQITVPSTYTVKDGALAQTTDFTISINGDTPIDKSGTYTAVGSLANNTVTITTIDAWTTTIASGQDIVIVLTAATLTNSPTTGMHNISIVTTTDWSTVWDTGLATFSINNANKVTVTATVEPTLTLALADATVNLGTLSAAGVTNSATDPTATVSTNAQGGYSLYVADTDGTVGLASVAAWSTIAAVANTTDLTWVEWFGRISFYSNNMSMNYYSKQSKNSLI